MVDLGEWRALGNHPDGRPWRAATGAGAIDVADNALAVSSGAGTRFEPSGKFHHIFDPASGASADRLREVAVVAPRAMIADALATAICVAGEERALARGVSGRAGVVTRTDGKSVPFVRAKAGTQS